jgi:hypothetical protein
MTIEFVKPPKDAGATEMKVVEKEFKRQVASV